MKVMRTAICLLVGLVVACGGGPSQAPASPSPLSYAQLAARPMKLPSVLAGQSCPVSPVTMLGGEASRIGTPMRLGFGHDPTPKGGLAFNKTVWDFSGAPVAGNAVLRGARIDGDGHLYFAGSGAGPQEVATITVTDSRGGQVSFYPQLRVPIDSTAAFFTYPTTSGCYAIQADSDSFTEVIVFKAT
jgi:hypothetical protein